MSRLAKSRIFGAAAALSAVVAMVAGWRAWSDLGSIPLLLAFAVVYAASGWAASHYQPADIDEIWQFDEAIYIAAAMVLPPSAVVLVFGLGTVIGQVCDRIPPRAIGANAGINTVGALTAISLLQWVDRDPGSTLLLAVAASASVVLLVVVSELLQALYFVFVGREPFVATLWTALRFRVARSPLLVSLGLVAGLAGIANLWALTLGVPLLALVQITLAAHTRVQRDRQRTQGLFEAAGQVHATVQRSEVEAALLEATRRLLRCNTAELREGDVGSDEWGAPVAANDGKLRHLVASQPRNGRPLDDEAGHLLSALAAVGASALENARLVEEIQHRAVHDPLTGLANQVLFEDRVSQAIATARRNRERFAVMVLDLDAFKKINDSLGHSQGNELLRLMADRLAGSIRDIDTVARLGSDHFTLLLPGIGDADQAALMCEKLLGVVRRPVSLGGHELFMTASAGLAFFPEDGTRAEHLLRNADGAMHRAKEMGRDTFQAYASGMNEAAHMRLVRESELHLALQRDELRLRYQPQIDLRSGRIVGVEALVRWEHPVLGLIGPHEFVPLAEESGLIVAVDTWVMHEACQQAKAWVDQGLPELRMAVNLSGRHFQASERLLDTVQLALLESGLDPLALELEVTEGIAVGEEQGTGRLLQQVRELGVRIAIDDFGTGYSMLGRLQKFPIDKLKIDRSFVMEIETAHGEAPIVAAMIAMARSLKIEVVAEGVETLEQQTFLRFHGCDQAQGFLFSHPVEAGEIEHLLRTPSLGFNVSAPSV